MLYSFLSTLCEIQSTFFSYTLGLMPSFPLTSPHNMSLLELSLQEGHGKCTLAHSFFESPTDSLTAYLAATSSYSCAMLAMRFASATSFSNKYVAYFLFSIRLGNFSAVSRSTPLPGLYLGPHSSRKTDCSTAVRPRSFMFTCSQMMVWSE